MDLSTEQTVAYDAIQRWLTDKDKWFFKLGGFAGTGKTHLLGHLVNNMNADVLCCAPTGKAAQALQRKLNGVVVNTVHHLLYSPIVPDTAEYYRLKKLHDEDPKDKTISRELDKQIVALTKAELKFALNHNESISSASVIIVDEASMVTPIIANDLKDTNCKVLFVGDPGQLPPVKADDWFSSQAFDMVLTKVVRQAEDSPIIRLSMEIRNGRNNWGAYDDDTCRVATSRKDVKVSRLLATDQIITATNAVRHQINRLVRTKRGLCQSWMPKQGERVICTSTAHKYKGAMINGTQFSVTEDVSGSEVMGYFAQLENEDGSLVVPMYNYYFKKTYDASVFAPDYKYIRGLVHLDYAYGITAHKAQGSEWDDVVVLTDDWIMGQPYDFVKRWLYTAVTRASKRLVLAL